MSYTLIRPKGKGRPPTHPVDRLRTRLWFHVVKLRSGLPSAHAIEMKLDGERIRKRGSDINRPKKWESYRDGKKVPSDVPGPRNAIDQAESWFTGTARWFRSPLWPVLRGEKQDRFSIEHALRQLQPEVVDILFEPEPREYETQSRSRSFDAECMERLFKLGSFDCLAASVLWVALSEEIASPGLRKTALHLYFELQALLKNQPEIQPFYPELFSCIDMRCKHWAYPLPNQRMDVVIFWHGYQEYLEEQERAKDAQADDDRETGC